MVSPELLRRYPFFAGLSEDELQLLAIAGSEIEYDEGAVLFHRNDQLDYFYILLEGEIGIVIDMTAREVEHDIASQLTGMIATEDIVCSSIIPGEIVGWSALFPPFTATAAAKALSDAKVIQFGASDLLEAFEYNARFGFKMSQKLALVIQERLQDRRMELLSQLVNHSH